MSSTRRDAQERVAGYYESCLRELIGHVGIALDRYRYRTDGDAEQMNTALYQYHRAAGELWKFCWVDGGGSQLEFVASRTTPHRRRTGGSAAHHDARAPLMNSAELASMLQLVVNLDRTLERTSRQVRTSVIAAK